MFLAAALPRSLLGPSGSTTTDREQSGLALAEALVATARDAFPGSDVEIVWTGGESVRVRFYAARPSANPPSAEDRLAELLQIHAHAPKLHERIQRVWGAVIEQGAWRTPAPARPSA